MAICHKCLEHSVVFPVDLFWSNLHLMFPPIPSSWNSRVWSFFLSILGIETFFLEGFKVFCVVLMKDKSSQIKNRKLWWQKRVSLMYCFHFFRNQLWRRLISCNSFRNVNMCLLEVAMREKFYFFWRGGSVPHYMPWIVLEPIWAEQFWYIFMLFVNLEWKYNGIGNILAFDKEYKKKATITYQQTVLLKII